MRLVQPTLPEAEAVLTDKAVLDLDVFLGADYSQIELRMLAQISGDPLLIKQFNSGVDIHSQVGHALTGWPIEKIRKDQAVRRDIKGFHFGLVFGVSKNGTYDYMRAKGAKITRQQCDDYYDRYFRTYKGVATYMQRTREGVERTGVVESLFGFRREIRKDDESRKTYYLNQAINTPVQSSAHQLVLMALALLDRKPKTYRLLQRAVAEVHDALYFFTRLRHLPEAYRQVKALLENDVAAYANRHFGVALKVPLLAEAKAGFCLGSMVDYDGGRIDAFLESWRAKHRSIKLSSWKDLLPDQAG
jgi:DNA polymerase-1